MKMLSPLTDIGYKAWCAFVMKAVQPVPGSCHLLALGATYLLCQVHEATNHVSAMHQLQGVQHALENTVIPWVAMVPSFLPGGQLLED